MSPISKRDLIAYRNYVKWIIVLRMKCGSFCEYRGDLYVEMSIGIGSNKQAIYHISWQKWQARYRYIKARRYLLPASFNACELI